MDETVQARYAYLCLYPHEYRGEHAGERLVAFSNNLIMCGWGQIEG